MNITGIIRRIDDLGRVLIPKEIRRVINIHEGDAFEIFLTKEGGIYLKKYIPDDGTIPEDPETTLKDEPIVKEKARQLIGINGTLFMKLTEEQCNLLDVLCDTGYCDKYEIINDTDILTP